MSQLTENEMERIDEAWRTAKAPSRGYILPKLFREFEKIMDERLAGKVAEGETTIFLCQNCGKQIGQAISGGTLDLSSIEIPDSPYTASFTENFDAKS
jgi:hypothetical protein